MCYIVYTGTNAFYGLMIHFRDEIPSRKKPFSFYEILNVIVITWFPTTI